MLGLALMCLCARCGQMAGLSVCLGKPYTVSVAVISVYVCTSVDVCYRCTGHPPPEHRLLEWAGDGG